MKMTPSRDPNLENCPIGDNEYAAAFLKNFREHRSGKPETFRSDTGVRGAPFGRNVHLTPDCQLLDSLAERLSVGFGNRRCGALLPLPLPGCEGCRERPASA